MTKCSSFRTRWLFHNFSVRHQSCGSHQILLCDMPQNLWGKSLVLLGNVAGSKAKSMAETRFSSRRFTKQLFPNNGALWSTIASGQLNPLNSLPEVYRVSVYTAVLSKQDRTPFSRPSAHGQGCTSNAWRIDYVVARPNTHIQDTRRANSELTATIP